jgi:hypothetical protein
MLPKLLAAFVWLVVTCILLSEEAAVHGYCSPTFRILKIYPPISESIRGQIWGQTLIFEPL